MFVAGSYPEAKFLKTKLGSTLMVDEGGFWYSRNYKNINRSFWKCVKSKTHKCRGTAITEGLNIIMTPGVRGHTHPPNPSSNLKVRKQTINRCTNEKQDGTENVVNRHTDREEQSTAVPNTRRGTEKLEKYQDMVQDLIENKVSF
jgi:hypothetical protein